MSERPVRWAQHALDEYNEALGYLRQKDPLTAEGYLRAVEEAIEGLARRNTGRPGRVSGSFEKSIQRYSYVIAYMYDSETLHILRVIHTARDWPEGRWPKD